MQLRLAVTLRHPRESVKCLPAIIDAASSFGFIPASWTSDRFGKNLVLIAREATCSQTSWENCTVVADPSCIIPPANAKGTFTWTFKVLKGHQITVGIVLAQFNPDAHDYINKTKLGWGYYQGDGKIGHGGPASKSYGTQYKVQDGKAVLVEGDLAHSVPLSCSTLRHMILNLITVYALMLATILIFTSPFQSTTYTIVRCP